MAYTVPNFNVFADVWSTGHVPSEDDPDFENLTVQFYIYSRVSFDVQPCELELYQPPIQIRIPVAAPIPWAAGQVFEVPAESGRYYRARFKERVHIGFPNEYLVVVVSQCGADGIPVLRDIEGAEPCGGPGPGEHDSSGFGGIDAALSSNATAERNPEGELHNAIGTGEIEGNLEGEGEANRQTDFHSSIGSGSIAGTLDGEGEAERII